MGGRREVDVAVTVEVCCYDVFFQLTESYDGL